MAVFRPMLAANSSDAVLRFPLYASPKLDGIRCLIKDSKPITRTLKNVPNDHIRRLLHDPLLDGFDGELVVGSPTSKDCYRTTSSGVMSHDGEPKFTYLVFDLHNHGSVDFATRYEYLKTRIKALFWERVPLVPHVLILTEQELEAFEAKCVADGYEGVITRDPRGSYKFGRSTAREQGMLKIKRFEDSEAEVLAVEELFHNDNVATINELGRTKRSSHKANLRSGNTMGALFCSDIHTGALVSIGSGFTDAERANIWNARQTWVGVIIKYKFFRVGMKGNVPRHPIYIGTRDKLDIEVGEI